MAKEKVRRIRDRGEPRESNARVITRKGADVAGANTDVLKAVEAYSNKVLDDPFSYGTTGDKALEVIPPPFNPCSLAKLPTQNNMLLQCLNALTTNVHLTGHTLVYVGPPDQEESEESKDEKRRIESLLAMPDGKHTTKMVRRKIGMDYETVGYWYLEVGRNGKGDIAWFSPLASTETRLCKLDPEELEIDRWLVRDGEYVKITLDVQFRRAVQQKGNKKKYFKEFGDPRVINPITGKVDPKLNPLDGATEFIYFGRYFPGHEYGLPRWINNIPAILGSREMEVVNLHFFYDNAIPALAVMVAGGSLTAESVTALEDMFTNVRGRESMNRVLILEAMPSDDLGGTEDNPPVPKISLETLNKDRQNDAMFTEYDQENQKKIRSTCQLPPLFVGLAEDHSFAAANSAMQVAENQVFSPDRSDFDDIFNMTILSRDGKPPLYWKMRSNMTRMSDPDAVMNGLTTLNAMGAATPNIGIQMANEMYGLSIPKIEEEWGNLPFSMILEMVKTNLFKLSDEAQLALEGIDKVMSKFKKPPEAAPVPGKGKPDAPPAKVPPGKKEAPTSNAKQKKRIELRKAARRAIRNR